MNCGMDSDRDRIAYEQMRQERERPAPKYRRMTASERRAYLAKALRPVPQPMCWCGRKANHNGDHRGVPKRRHV